MILPAAASDGVFLKPPPTGRRFARVENLRARLRTATSRQARFANRFNKLRGQGCDAGKPLDEIQRDSLGAQDCARRAGDFQQRSRQLSRAGHRERNVQFGFRWTGKFAKCGFRKIQSGDDERLARTHDGAGCHVCGNGSQRRRVAAADVLGEGGLDGLMDFFRGQFHAVKMKAKGKWGKENEPTGKSA